MEELASNATVCEASKIQGVVGRFCKFHGSVAVQMWGRNSSAFAQIGSVSCWPWSRSQERKRGEATGDDRIATSASSRELTFIYPLLDQVAISAFIPIVSKFLFLG
jgi:hypothetical protein